MKKGEGRGHSRKGSSKNKGLWRTKKRGAVRILREFRIDGT